MTSSLRTLPRTICFSTLLVTLSCGAGGGGLDSEQVAAGQKRFLQTCAACHGLDGKGLPRLGANLHNNEFVQGRSDDELVEFLKVGRPATDPRNDRGVDMPPRGGNPALREGELRSIVSYLRNLE